MREYDLILGILACQLRLVTRGSLIRSVAESTESTEPLSEILLSNRALSVEDHELLIRLVDNIIHAHRGDEKAALETFGGQEAVESAFIQSVHFEDETWQARKDATILAEELPHGLPAQIMPETLGRYTGGSEYARGGIGRVLLVHDEQMGRDIILKELLPQHATSPTAETLSRPPSPGSPIRQSAAMMARFLQEAKVTGQLEHPSIVPVYELGIRTDGQLYYTMKLVRGHTLSVAIKQCKGLDTRLALLRSYLDICQAMAYAHSKSIIHRDLKPSNVMIGEFGECVVLDWGLAKVLEGQDAHQDDLNKTIDQLNMEGQDPKGHHTRSKEVLGTPLYMSPEQARGENDQVGPRSDVYCLGVILYEILSGEVPHLWTNTLDTVKRVGTLPAPPLHSAAPDVAPELAAICDKALRHKADERYPSARELADDINQFLDGAVVEAYSYNARDLLKRVYQRNKTLIHSGALATAAILAIGIYSYIHIAIARDEAEVARDLAEENARIALAAQTQAETAEAAEKVARSEAESSLALALRQQYLAQIRLAQSHIKEQEMRLANEALEAAPESERDWVWRYLHNEANASLFRVRSEKSIIFSAHYDPTGEYIVAFRNPEPPGLYRAQDGEFIHDFEGDERPYSNAAFSNDGAYLAALGEENTLDVWVVATGERLQRFITPNPGEELAFTLDNKAIWVAYGEGPLIEWDLQTGEERRRFGTDGQTMDLVVPALEGKFLLTQLANDEPSHTIIAWNTETGEVQYQLPGLRFWVTPDGEHVLIAATPVSSAANPDSKEPYQHPQFLYKLSLHDIGTGKLIREFPGHTDRILHVSFGPRRDQFVSSSVDRTVQVWSLDQEQATHRFHTDVPAVNTYLILDGQQLIGSTDDNRHIIWDIDSGEQVTTFAGQNKLLSVANISPSRNHLLYASAHHTFEVIDIQKRLSESQSTRNDWLQDESHIQVTDIVISGNDRIAAIVGNRRVIRLLNLESMEWLSQYECEADTIPNVLLTEDGNGIYYCKNPTTVVSGNVVGGGTSTFKTTSARITSLAIDTANRLVAIATLENQVLIWERSTGALVHNIEISSPVHAMTFGEKDTNLIVGCDDGHVRIFELNNGSIQLDISAHVGRVIELAASNEGATCASAGSDGSISVWATNTGEEIGHFDNEESFNHLQEEQLQLRFSKTGKYLSIHSGIFRTRIVDLRHTPAMLQPFNSTRFDVLDGGGTLLHISNSGSVARLKTGL